MSGQLTAAIALACVGVVQAILTVILSGSKFFAKRYEKLLDDFTTSELQFDISDFFHDREDPDKVRLKRVATVSGTAISITTQCASLIVTALSAAALAWVSFHRLPWFLGSLALAAAAIALGTVLLRRAANNELLTFGMKLRGWRKTKLTVMFSLNSMNPYVLLQLIAVGYAAAVGVVF